MANIGHVWRLKPGKAEEYDQRHKEIWPELADRLRVAGVLEYQIYRWGEILFSHLVVADYDALTSSLVGDAVSERWEEYMSDLLEYPNADPVTGWPERLRHVWSLDNDQKDGD